MKNILDITVSRFDNYYSPDNPQDVSLLHWLTSNEYQTEIEELRTIEDKAQRAKKKSVLPGVTVSGTFSYRKNSGLTQHSGLICIDIDAQDNSHIVDFEEQKWELAKISNIAYCGLSASGRHKGLYCIMPIAYPDKHEQHFNALKNVFYKQGLTVDGACRDVCRMRGASWDENPYINLKATTYTGLYVPPLPQHSHNKYNFKTDSGKQVKILIESICTRGLDISGDYNQWLSLGFALTDEFGEAGRAFFHDISRFHSSYDNRECDKQYSACLKSCGRGVTIATLFQICKDYGITLK